MDDAALMNSLQGRITQLEQECATLRAEAKDRRLKNKALREDNERFAAALEETAAERNQYKAAIEAEPHELQAQVDDYRARLRERDHRDKFRELGRKLGVTADKALDDLYQLSGYKPESDEISETQITAAIGQTLQGRDWLKSPVAAAGAANGQPAAIGTTGARGAAQATQLQPGPGASRGGASVRDDFDSILENKYPNPGRLA